MKTHKSVLFLIIVALVLIGLTGCTITINGPDLAPGEPGRLLRQAIGAPQIAAIRDRNTQVVVHPSEFVHEAYYGLVFPEEVKALVR